MDKDLFLADILRKPEVLASLDGYNFGWPDLRSKRLFFVGMGSSHYAAKTIAHRLQIQGINAYAMLASAETLPLLTNNDVVIAISASGKSVETNDFIERLNAPVVLLTNSPDAVSSRNMVLDMNATKELGGVSSLSYMATLIALLQLEENLTNQKVLADTLQKSVRAAEHIIQSRELWEEKLAEFVSGPDGVQFVAPLERLSSAEQSALMIRECARRKADASETGDWSHVDVYLTKTTDYRMIAFSGSRWSGQMLKWTTQRNSKVLHIGNGSPNPEFDYPHSEEGLVSLLTEVTYAEIAGASLWYQFSE